MSGIDTRTLAELPQGVAVTSVLRSDNGRQMHVYEVRRYGLLVAVAYTLSEIAQYLQQIVS